MRKTVTVIGVAGALILGQTAVAGPAGAARKCSYDPSTFTTVCHGGQSETSTGGGGAGGYYMYSPTDYTFSGGAGVPGGAATSGAYGEHCTGNNIDYSQKCVGSNHHP
jgi:hypothetical protein